MKNDMGTLEYLIEDVGGPRKAARLLKLADFGCANAPIYRRVRG